MFQIISPAVIKIEPSIQELRLRKYNLNINSPFIFRDEAAIHEIYCNSDDYGRTLWNQELK